jgi:hypothetical protein
MSNWRVFIKDAGLFTLGVGLFPSLLSYPGADSLSKPFKVNLKFLFSVNRLQNKPDDREDISGKIL